MGFWPRRCAYHGWRFDARGKCLVIPQSDSGGRDEAQKAACAKVYPTKVRLSPGLIPHTNNIPGQPPALSGADFFMMDVHRVSLVCGRPRES